MQHLLVSTGISAALGGRVLTEGVGSAGGELKNAIEPDSPLYAALLLKRNGVLKSSWYRSRGSEEVLSVMSATLMASIDAMAEALGCSVPQTFSCETESCRVLAVRTELPITLILVAPKSVSEGYLRHLARQVFSQIPSSAGDARNQRPLLDQRV